MSREPEPWRPLDFAATITSELMRNENDRPEGRSRASDIAGAGLIPNPATAVLLGQPRSFTESRCLAPCGPRNQDASEKGGFEVLTAPVAGRVQ